MTAWPASGGATTSAHGPSRAGHEPLAPDDPVADPGLRAAYGERRDRAERDLHALIDAVRAHWGQPLATAGPFVSAFRFLDLVGQHCLARPMNCIGDTQDADYQIGPSLRIDDGEVIAVVGTLGTATGNATYVSLSVNRFEVLMGVANLNDAELAGTAAPFAGALQNDARLFHVHYAARHCTGLGPCLELPTALVPAGEVIKFLQRNYIFPGTNHGPDPTKLLNPVAIVLDGSQRPTAA